MKYKLNVMKKEEQKYTYRQSDRLNEVCGLVGYLRGDFGSNGNEWYSTWFDGIETLKTQKFKNEFDDVINELRANEQYIGLLNNRKAMEDYCRSYSEGLFDNKREYGFRIATDDYLYLFRVNPYRGEYNFYCYCYNKPLFEAHFKKATKGIVFLDAKCKELFRIADGDRICIYPSDPETSDIRECAVNYVCRYIDDEHFEYSYRERNMREFVASMAKLGIKYEPADK